MNKEILENAVNEGLSIRQLQKRFDLSNGSIRYWLKVHDLKTNGTKDNLVWTKELIMGALTESTSLSDILRKLGLTTRAGNFQTLQKYAGLHSIELPVYDYQKGKRGKTFPKKLTADEMFIEGSNTSRNIIKRQLISEGRGSECEMCGQPNSWHGKELRMILDHKNGVNNDNRRINLRFLCPNCNSTLDTHCGKNINKVL